MRSLCIFLACIGVVSGVGRLLADEEVFSGPQVDETLEPFKVRGAYDLAGKDVDFVKDAAGKPLVLIFVHELNRPTVGITRILTSYLLTRHEDGLETGVVWLAESVDEGERTLKRIRHAMTDKAPTGISVDGNEGPGAYGLNRNVQITVLVAKEDKVTANFALVQPSVQADLPKILQAVVDVVGGEVPKLEDLPAMREMQRDRMREAKRNSKSTDAPGDEGDAEAAERLRPLLRKLIRKGANAEEIEAAAEAVEKFVAENEAAKKELQRIATTIVDSGKLENYGEEAARDVLRRWAEEAKEKNDGESEPKDDKSSESPAKPKSDA